MATQVILAWAGTTSWTVPSNVNKIDWVECIGPGASGANGTGTQQDWYWGGPGGNGGGGGAYARRNNLPVTPGEVISVTCTGEGGYSQFGPNYCLAYGANGQTRGIGANGVGDIKYDGGDGGTGGPVSLYSTGGGGGGGGGAGGRNGSGLRGVDGQAGDPGWGSARAGGAGGNGGANYGGAGGYGGPGRSPGGTGANGFDLGSWGAGGGAGGGGGGFYLSGAGYPQPYDDGQAAGGPGYYGGGGGGGGGGDQIEFAVGGAGSSPAIGLIVLAYTPIDPPTVTACTPNKGPVSGGRSVTITGTNFTDVTSVTFGGAAATGITILDATRISCVTPAHAAGAVNIAATSIGGTGTGTGLYIYTSDTGGNMAMLGF